MSKITKILAKASEELNLLNHPNKESLQEQLSVVVDSLQHFSISEDTVAKVNQILDDIEEAKLQSQEESQISEKINLAAQNIFNSTYRLIERHSTLNLNQELKSILEKNSIEELVTFIQLDKLKLYTSPQEDNRLKQQIKKYQKACLHLNKFELLSFKAEFTKASYELDFFIEPKTTNTKIKTIIPEIQNQFPEVSIAIQENTFHSKILPTNLNKNWIGLSLFFLCISTYVSYLNQSSLNNTTQSSQNINYQINYIEANPFAKKNIYIVREFIISLINTDINNYYAFELSDHCDYQQFNINQTQPTIYITSGPNGAVNQDVCIYNPHLKTTQIMLTEDAFLNLNFEQYDINSIKKTKENPIHFEATSFNQIKNLFQKKLLEQKKLITIKNLDSNIVNELINLNSIQDLLKYPKIIQILKENNLISNKKIYSTNIPYAEDNYIIIEKTKDIINELIVLTFQRNLEDPNTLIIDVTNFYTTKQI